MGSFRREPTEPGARPHPNPGVPALSAGAQAGPYEGLEAEECGILDGCAHGRCVRVPEGFTCDCFDGYRLDMTRMACVGEGWAGASMEVGYKRGWKPLLGVGNQGRQGDGSAPVVSRK